MFTKRPDPCLSHGSLKFFSGKKKEKKQRVRSELRIEVSIGFSVAARHSRISHRCRFFLNFEKYNPHVMDERVRQEREWGKVRIRKTEGETEAWGVKEREREGIEGEKERLRVDCQCGERGSRVWRRGMGCWLIHAGDLGWPGKGSRAEYQCFLLYSGDALNRVWQNPTNVVTISSMKNLRVLVTKLCGCS